MDKHNLFHTRATYALIRMDYLVILAGLSALVLWHHREVHWWRFWAAFWWIDVAGTFPGMLAWHRRPGGRGRIPAAYHVLYNVAHSVPANALVAAAWWLGAGGFEWAMLALPIHLCGDRAVFGNIYKPFGLAFEPRPDPGFAGFIERYRQLDAPPRGAPGSAGVPDTGR